MCAGPKKTKKPNLGFTKGWIRSPRMCAGPKGSSKRHRFHCLGFRFRFRFRFRACLVSRVYVSSNRFRLVRLQVSVKRDLMHMQKRPIQSQKRPGGLRERHTRQVSVKRDLMHMQKRPIPSQKRRKCFYSSHTRARRRQARQ